MADQDRDQERERWTKLVADYEGSDLTQREFASERGISLGALRNWIYRPRKQSRPLAEGTPVSSGQAPARAPVTRPSHVVPVRVAASAPKARLVEASSPLLELAPPIGHRGAVSAGHRALSPRSRRSLVAVLTIPGSVRIWIGSTPIDMRKAIDGLLAIELRKDAYSGHLFVFVLRRCVRVKILAWDKGGFVLLYKRLDTSREEYTLMFNCFQRPGSGVRCPWRTGAGVAVLAGFAARLLRKEAHQWSLAQGSGHRETSPAEKLRRVNGRDTDATGVRDRP
ncbi:MAG TPA: IS66 family insertion sequence element accessory protein TnpB [Anaeromyxobacteraceae bacterium]|nr:IS66 family insertion sequence element accessory protein TnpB [Anaeromyxobacteraceae bacterium]